MTKYHIRSPLRYPGGKSKFSSYLLSFFPEIIEDYREPFLGGGSILLSTIQKYNDSLYYWGNDLNKDLIYFWIMARDFPDEMITSIKQIKDNTKEGKKLFQHMKRRPVEELSIFERGIRYFILNRITFSGTVDSGGYSESSFKKRFTDSSINRIKQCSSLLSKVKITHTSYEDCILTEGKNVFLFLDPPYFSSRKSRLYGKYGDLHIFDYEKFANDMYECNHKWLITYDDCPIIRELFSFAYCYPWTVQYGMNNYKRDIATKGKEVIICNYKINNKDIKTIHA